MKRNIPRKFDPKTMQRDQDDPKIIYVSTLTLGESMASPETGNILIGTEGNPTKEEIAKVIRHEKGHLGRRQFPFVGIASVDHLTRARHELASYDQERKSSSAREWNKVLPSHIKAFMGYLTWVSKPYQRKIKPKAKRILSPKKGGGNEQAVYQAQADLAQWWLEEQKLPARIQIVATRRSVEDIERELHSGAGVARPQTIKLGVAYTSGGRLCRKPHRGWRKIKYT
jgi:hypothetical protein